MINDSSLFVIQFIAKVREALSSCGFAPGRLAVNQESVGVAVSGGADSVSLLAALACIAKDAGFFLHAITVNHNIRQAEETCGDAQFVQQLCASLHMDGYPVDCTLKVIPPGKVAAVAERRGKGLEESARYLRYQAFDEFSVQAGTACICLAHNRNDQLETLLMRFLQGSGGEAAAGIRKVRGIFVRPLLDIPRCDIERFLTENHFTWRTDSTNSDTRYLRNRIRHIIMPELDRTVPGWQTAVMAGGKKAADTDDVISAIADGITWNCSGKCVKMPYSVFSLQKKAVQTRLLYTAFGLAGCMHRIPYSFIERICSCGPESVGFRENAAGMAVEIKNGMILVEKEEKRATDSGFSAIINKIGSYDLPCGTIDVICNGTGGFSVFLNDSNAAAVHNVPLPFCIRSRQPGDEVKTASGGMKSVSDILSDWKVCEENKERIPVIQELFSPFQQIICVWGSVYEYDDWIAKT
jgi:tRNA(Ile)-lysidine synthase